MAITSELIGKLGGADIQTVELNIPIKSGKGFQTLHTIQIDKPSFVAVSLTHDNTNSFKGTSGRAAICLTGEEEIFYGANYGVSSAAGNPLGVTATLDAGAWQVKATSNVSSANYIAQTLTICTAEM